jgi:uncharacterized protein with GYD domain
MNTQPKNLENVRKALLNTPEVLSADSVFGPYDVICSVRAKDQADLAKIVFKLQNISGVESSMTSIIAPINILAEW